MEQQLTYWKDKVSPHTHIFARKKHDKKINQNICIFFSASKANLIITHNWSMKKKKIKLTPKKYKVLSRNLI